MTKHTNKERLTLTLASPAQSPSIPRVPPSQPTRITARTVKGAFDLARIYVSGAGTPGGAADWVVNDIEIDGRSQLKQKDLPGTLFGSHGVASAPRASTALMLSSFDPVERGQELALIVTYIGPNPEGVPFYASVIGERPPQRPTVMPIAPSAKVPRATKIAISARVENAPFQIDRVEIDDGWDWKIEDMRINGKSQFLQAGGMPGDMFATSAIDTFVKMETCLAGNAIEIDAIYIGTAESSSFKGQIEGTVVRVDDDTPPPDLHVVIEAAGESAVVIATCNWRTPAVECLPFVPNAPIGPGVTTYQPTKRWTAPRPGILKNFQIDVRNNSLMTNTTFIVQTASGDGPFDSSALRVDVPRGATSGLTSSFNVPGPISLNRGDRVRLQVITNGTVGEMSFIGSVDFDQEVANER